jgi:hypothetical protein
MVDHTYLVMLRPPERIGMNIRDWIRQAVNSGVYGCPLPGPADSDAALRGAEGVFRTVAAIDLDIGDQQRCFLTACKSRG